MNLDDFVIPKEATQGGYLARWVEERNRTETDFPRDATIQGSFSEQAQIGPDRVAAVHGDGQLTYSELDRESNLLARFLVEHGLGRESFAGVLLDRSLKVPVAMLGILKAGGAYVPLDSGTPLQRTAYMLKETRARILVSSTRFSPMFHFLLAECPELKIVCCLDDAGARLDGGDVVDWRVVAENSAEPLPERSGPHDLAYLIYTSGTSGQPKGVMVEHRSILRLVRNTNYVSLDRSDRILQTGALAFDASTFEIWGALLAGAAVCFSETTELLRARDLEKLFERHRITTLFLTTGLFNLYAGTRPDMFSKLRTLLTGGEKVSVHHVNRVRQTCPELDLLHVYGPTENTTFSTFFRVDKPYERDVPIGAPIGNSTAYILNGDLQPLPPGMEGELCVGGDGLARGYLNDPELTAAKFVPHPLLAGERLYRTGDVASWLPDGNIVFVGRSDEQIKVRGFRIEPAEIEHHIRSHEHVYDAVVVARSRQEEDKEICAYVTGSSQLDVDDLRLLLKQRLPEYMVPVHLVQLEALPLNASGKVDRRALREPSVATLATGYADDSSQSEAELQMVAIWQEVLARPDVGPTDDFFDLGGHSLKATKLASLIQKKMGVEVSLTAVFKHSTPRDLTRHLLETTRFGVEVADEPLVRMTRNDSRRSLFAFPPGSGDALSFAQLAEYLDSFELYGFNFLDAESRLEDYAEMILQVDSDGPYLLMGYSGGGNLAYHVARVLEARSKRVARVVMFDSARNLAQVEYSRDLARQLARDYMDTDEFRPYVDNAILRERIIRRVQSYYAFFSHLLDEHTIDARIDLITSEGSALETRDASGRLLVSKLRWSEVASGGFERYAGQGNHNNMLYKPYVEPNTRLLTELLSQTTQDP